MVSVVNVRVLNLDQHVEGMGEKEWRAVIGECGWFVFGGIRLSFHIVRWEEGGTADRNL